ncbi:pentapeptide repeat-containing protein [Micromonospora chalcea]|uniref:pentapeptide repeat-containing protein n=1 Tax=Micromonospora chalcea TaxID=1874 RepID=UPI0037925539
MEDVRKIVGLSGATLAIAAITAACLTLSTRRDWEIVPYVPLYGALFTLGLALLIIGLSLLTSNETPAHLKPMRPITVQWLLGGAMVVILTTWGAAALMMSFAAHVNSPDERAKLRFDALKTSLTVGAGAAGAVALVLGFRRQWLNERAQHHLEFDASEQRVTNLYTKAADQLGHEKAAVRLAGLYALERVAQKNPEHRQTIVDVICAYLRMPLPHNPWSRRDADSYEGEVDPPDEFLAAAKSYREELHVRDAAQAIIVKHLVVTEGIRDGQAHTFWPDLDLDLRGAHLRDFSLDHCSVRKADFTGAEFDGMMSVARTVFQGTPWGESGPVGVGGVSFALCKFGKDVVFEDVEFRSDASFTEATFRRSTFFGGVDFMGECDFSSTVFRGRAEFEGSVFHDGVDFEDATFRDVTFSPSGGMYIRGATFGGSEANFTDATFDGSVDFREAIFSGEPTLDEAAPNGSNFTGARAKVGDGDSQTWPAGWRRADEAEDGYAPLVRDEPECVANG